ncbi:4Fe-4S binding protein [Persephonella sp.]
MRKFSDVSLERDKNDLFRFKIFRNTFGNIKFLNSIRVILLLLTLYAIFYGLFFPDNIFTTGLFWGLFWPFFMVITLPTLGNVFCMICPHGFLSRKISNIGLKLNIPKSLKNPYIGIALNIALYWFILYTFPGVLRNSFAAAIFFLFFTLLAIFVSFLFTNGTYCKYFCPIGRVAPAFARVGFTWLSTYKTLCDKCDKPDCAFSCPYKYNPSKFDKDNSMYTCTLCMECANSCEGVRFSIKRLSHSLLKKILKPQAWEIWVYILFFAVITMTMRFHHGLGHSPIKENLPWVLVGKWIHEVTGIGKPVDFVGLTALLMATGITLFLVLGGFYITSKIIRKPFKEVFLNLGYGLAPLMIIGGLSHVCHFFFTHYYHEIINGFAQAFFLDIQVEPLASRKDKWLRIFWIFPYIAGLWSMYILWRRLSFFDIKDKFTKIKAYIPATAIVIFYLGISTFIIYTRVFMTGSHH